MSESPPSSSHLSVIPALLPPRLWPASPFFFSEQGWKGGVSNSLVVELWLMCSPSNHCKQPEQQHPGTSRWVISDRNRKKKPNKKRCRSAAQLNKAQMWNIHGDAGSAWPRRLSMIPSMPTPPARQRHSKSQLRSSLIHSYSTDYSFRYLVYERNSHL